MPSPYVPWLVGASVKIGSRVLASIILKTLFNSTPKIQNRIYNPVCKSVSNRAFLAMCFEDF